MFCFWRTFCPAGSAFILPDFFLFFCGVSLNSLGWDWCPNLPLQLTCLFVFPEVQGFLGSVFIKLTYRKVTKLSISYSLRYIMTFIHHIAVSPLSSVWNSVIEQSYYPRAVNCFLLIMSSHSHQPMKDLRWPFSSPISAFSNFCFLLMVFKEDQTLLTFVKNLVLER